MRKTVIVALAVIVVAAGTAWFFLTRSDEGEEFGSVSETVTAINEGGIECTGRKVLSRGEPRETGLCYVDDGTYEVDIYIFDTVDQRDRWLQGLLDVYDQEVVVGPNWYLTTGHRPLSERISEALGGEITEG